MGMTQAELFRLHPEYRHPKPPPAKLRLTRPEAAEADVLSSILAALKFYPRVVWFVRANSAAGKLIYPNGTTSQFMRFGFPGCPDILGMLDTGQFWCCEVKRASGRTTEAQAAFLDRVKGHGGIAFVAKSVDDLREHLA